MRGAGPARGAEGRWGRRGSGVGKAAAWALRGRCAGQPGAGSPAGSGSALRPASVPPQAHRPGHRWPKTVAVHARGIVEGLLAARRWSPLWRLVKGLGFVCWALLMAPQRAWFCSVPPYCCSGDVLGSSGCRAGGDKWHGQEAELPILLGTWRGLCCWSQSIGGLVAPGLGHVSPRQCRLLRQWVAEKVIYCGSVALERGRKALLSGSASAPPWASPLCFTAQWSSWHFMAKAKHEGTSLPWTTGKSSCPAALQRTPAPPGLRCLLPC